MMDEDVYQTGELFAMILSQGGGNYREYAKALRVSMVLDPEGYRVFCRKLQEDILGLWEGCRFQRFPAG